MSTKLLPVAETQFAHPGPEASPPSLLRLRCPACGFSDSNWALRSSELAEFACASCGFTLDRSGGIWRALAPAREERFQQFMIEYQTVRLREGRGSSSERFYLELPYRDVTGCNAWQWRIRGRSFRFFERRILPKIEGDHPRGLDILDIGAGNGWMSYRLALRGHRPVAVDLLVNTLDGLGAARRYFRYLPHSFPLFQAEMDRLPFDDRQFDLAVFNASFHYSEDYEHTLREVCRCLRRPGHLLILDSPLYHHDARGLRMLAERSQAFQKEFGFRSDSIVHRGYLTQEALDDLGHRLGFGWMRFNAWYGVGWALRPLKAFLLSKREPSKFFVFWATLGGSESRATT